MSAIDKLAARPTLQRSLVQQAMQEAKADPTAQQKLQQLVDQRAADFEDPGLVDTVQQFLQGVCSDRFEVVPNRQTGSLSRPEVLEARITKVKDEFRRVDITPPPPAPPMWRRDPLNVTGKAPAGSTVEFYNASIAGRPVLGTAVADASGKFSYELTDETKFVFGDQIGVRMVGVDGSRGRPLIVPTEPFLITNTETTYFQRQNGAEVTVRVDQASRTEALDKKTDDRAPFFQQARVDSRLDIPAVVEQPYAFTLIGRDDAVEPNSTISVTVGRETFQTKVDDQGQFALKVKDVIPGQQLKIEVRDLNGHGVDIPARVPPIALPTPQIVGALRPDGEGLHFSASDLVPPGGALIVRNNRTGEMSELRADAAGKVDGRLAVAPFDAFEIAVRDVNGHVSDETAWLVHLPAAGKGKASVVDVQTLNATPPDLGRALSCLTGPPVDVLVGGQPRPGGPFLPLTGLPKLPPFAVLEVVKDGAVVQALRADADGAVQNGMLRGVHVGDALSFRLRDAAGRLFPGQADGFVVPDGKVTSTVTTQVPPSLVKLHAAQIGSEGITRPALDPLWLAPATIHVGKTAPTDFQQRHALTSQLGGAILKSPDAAFMAAHAPELSLAEGATLTVKHQPGAKVVGVDVKGTPAINVAIAWDDTLHTFSPALTEADLPRLEQGLRGAVAVVTAAYAQGLEPGDVGYDRALGVAKTFMFALDHVARQSDTAKTAVTDAAVRVLGTKPFLLELTPKGVVGEGRPVAIETATSSSKSLLQTRLLAMGEVGRADRLLKPSHGAVDVGALSQAASFKDGALTLRGAGLVAPGDELLLKAGDTVHRVTADAKGHVDVSLAIPAGTVVEIAQRALGKDGARPERSLNPVVRAVVADGKGLVGEGHLVGLSALVQKAPSAVAVADAVLTGGPVPRGLPPGGSVVVVKDGVEVGRVGIDTDGQLQKPALGLKAGDVVDIRVHDAADRAFAPMVKGQVVGQKVTGLERLDTGAMTLSAVVDAVGTGRLVLPTFPKADPKTGARPNSEAYAELNPMWGHSSGVTDEHGRYSTKAAFPEGLLPALAKGPEKRSLSMGDSVKLSAHQWDDGSVVLNAGYFVENQRPDFGVVFNPATGELSDRFHAKTPLVPEGLAKLTTLLQTSLAFVALAQRQGSVPGDGFYDLAARTAKSTLVVFDSLIQQQPTFATEIKAALRAALPPAMPFDLPVGNATSTATPPPADAVSPTTLRFWNAVELDDFKQPRATANAGFDAFVPPRRETPSATGGGGFFGRQPSTPFFAPSSTPSSQQQQPSTIPMYLRGRLGG
jgi:hypothetical protein